MGIVTLEGTKSHSVRNISILVVTPSRYYRSKSNVPGFYTVSQYVLGNLVGGDCR